MASGINGPGNQNGFILSENLSVNASNDAEEVDDASMQETSLSTEGSQEQHEGTAAVLEPSDDRPVVSQPPPVYVPSDMPYVASVLPLITSVTPPPLMDQPSTSSDPGHLSFSGLLMASQHAAEEAQSAADARKLPGLESETSQTGKMMMGSSLSREMEKVFDEEPRSLKTDF